MKKADSVTDKLEAAIVRTAMQIWWHGGEEHLNDRLWEQCDKLQAVRRKAAIRADRAAKSKGGK